ncbi:DUF262 domain-containing protein [Actinomadura citrea]|uniref:GmrSD restriction endonuclease domain-containing protein n=1 Tax=Actinomadura citrea TaxID=46158 RepID=UPI002E28FE29|nr:DUF262 domain-containing protein [Actinomadura citrea]
MALDSPQLDALLDRVAVGRIQLPDFQREWKWDDERVVSILATVTMGYPMGVIMTLETGPDGAGFKARTLAGATDTTGGREEELLLDGQQRMTSLFQALRSGRPVDTRDLRGKDLKRWYYVDIEAAVAENGDREKAIVSVPEEKVVRSQFGRRVDLDLSTPELESEQGYFPLSLVFDNSAMLTWMFRYVKDDPARQAIWTKFQEAVVNNVIRYQVPTIRLGQNTAKEAVCTVFEKVNTGGVPLNVFELLTATFAGNKAFSKREGYDFRLPEHWDNTKSELATAHPVLADLQSTDFLQAVCLVSTYHREGVPVACKRRNMLDLELDQYLQWAPRIADALHWAGRFLAEQCVFRAEDLPYSTQLPPLAAIRTVLGTDTDTDEARAKLARWYWCGVFGEQYGGTVDSRFPRDLEQVVTWIRGGRVPESVQDGRFVETRLLSMQTRNSAAYKGVFALLLQQGCTDWFHLDKPLDGNLLEDYKAEIYRIFPARWCEKNGIDTQRQNSVVNKTLLSHRTGRIVGNRAPAAYLQMLERESGIQPNWLDDALLTHLVEPSLLRDSDFNAFFERRMSELLVLIERVMGRRTMRAEEEA